MNAVKLFKVFADTTRLRVVSLIANCKSEICVCDIADVLTIPASTVSRQLAILKNAGIVQDRRHGTWIHYSIADPTSNLHQVINNWLISESIDDVLKLDMAEYRRLRQSGKLCRTSSQVLEKRILKETV